VPSLPGKAVIAVGVIVGGTGFSVGWIGGLKPGSGAGELQAHKAELEKISPTKASLPGLIMVLSPGLNLLDSPDNLSALI
jgi:hypothetical protein